MLLLSEYQLRLGFTIAHEALALGELVLVAGESSYFSQILWWG